MMRRLIALRLALRRLQTTDLRYVVGYDEAVKRAVTAERELAQLKAKVAELKEVFDSAGNSMARSVDDWGSSRSMAWVWGLVLGWDCEEDHQHNPDDPTCINPLDEIAQRFEWSAEVVARHRRLRSAVTALEQPAEPT